MTFDPLAIPPMLTAELPGIGGRIKQECQDFEVEEIPAYAASGSGDFLYLWLEKIDMGAEYFQRQVARRLDLPVGEVGTAGLKDRRAVTRQMVSVPAAAEARLPQLEGDGIRVLRVERHTNKLRPGHLHGNRFNLLIRDVGPDTFARATPILERIRAQGLPNFYGEQRFGREGETVLIGLALLRNEPPPQVGGRRPNLRSPFLRKLALSAVQSVLFNHYLARRLQDGMMRQVLPGDVMGKWPAGGMFTAEDVVVEQQRFDRRETVHLGPMFGRKTFPAHGAAAEREQAVLHEASLTPTSFNGFGKLLQGTRRHNLVYVDDLSAEADPAGLRLRFTLPAGSYATVLLREVMKTSIDEEPSPVSSSDEG